MSNANGDSAILAALEKLGALFKWDAVSIWIERQPDGEIRFTTYLPADSSRCASCAFGHGDTLGQAVDELIREGKDRDPELQRQKAIKELEEQLAKLKAMDLRYPPYRPGTRLSPGALAQSIDV